MVGYDETALAAIFDRFTRWQTLPVTLQVAALLAAADHPRHLPTLTKLVDAARSLTAEHVGWARAWRSWQAQTQTSGSSVPDVLDKSV